MSKRNIWIVGHPDSGASEIFNAILRFDQTPPIDDSACAVSDTADSTDWGEYGDTDEPKYNAKKRKKPLIK